MAPNSNVQNNFVHLKLRRWLKILIWKILTFTWTSSSLSGLLICIIHQQGRCRSGGSRGRVSGQARWGQGPTKQLTWKWEALIKQSGSPYTHTRGPPSNVDLMLTRRRLIPRSCWFRLKSNLNSQRMSRDPSRICPPGSYWLVDEALKCPPTDGSSDIQSIITQFECTGWKVLKLLIFLTSCVSDWPGAVTWPAELKMYIAAVN